MDPHASDPSAVLRRRGRGCFPLRDVGPIALSILIKSELDDALQAARHHRDDRAQSQSLSFRRGVGSQLEIESANTSWLRITQHCDALEHNLRIEKDFLLLLFVRRPVWLALPTDPNNLITNP